MQCGPSPPHPPPRLDSVICPYCRTVIGENDVETACPQCRTRHHAECWGENGGCTVYGCVRRSGHQAVVVPPPPASYPQATPAGSSSLPPPSQTRRLGLVGALVVLLVGVSLGAVLTTRFFLAGQTPAIGQPEPQAYKARPPSTPSQEPSPPPTSQPIPTETAVEEVRSFYVHWVECWQSKDLEAYLGCYAPDCQIKRPGQDWYGKTTLRRRIADVFRRNRRIKIVTKTLRIDADEDSAFVAAEQAYSSPTYSDEGMKYLELRKQDGTWLIVKENASPRSTRRVIRPDAPPSPQPLEPPRIDSKMPLIPTWPVAPPDVPRPSITAPPRSVEPPTPPEPSYRVDRPPSEDTGDDERRLTPTSTRSFVSLSKGYQARNITWRKLLAISNLGTKVLGELRVPARSVAGHFPTLAVTAFDHSDTIIDVGTVHLFRTPEEGGIVPL